MEQGTLNELVLTRSVTKHIRRHTKDMLQGGAVGNDYSAIRLEEDILISAEGVSNTPRMAWINAMNNFYTSGGIPVGVRILIMLPESIEEADIKRFMTEFNMLADEEHIQILGGHTQVGKAYTIPSFCVTVSGKAQEYFHNIKDIKAGYQIVMTKTAGICGTDIIARNCGETLNNRLSPSYIERGYALTEEFSVKKEAMVATSMKDKVYYVHDVSFGGVYGALWQLGSKLNKGINIYHFDIPIKQETIEFCEIYNLNPYMLLGTGSLLVVTKDGQGLVEELSKLDIDAAVIGVVTEDKNRVVALCHKEEDVTLVEKRFLAPVKGDELYKVVSI